MKIGKILSVVLVAALVLSAQVASGVAISVNFVGGRPVAGGDTVTGTAGAVPVGNWNNADGASGGPVGVINSAGAAAATLTWNGTNEWSATGAAPGGGGNAAMMSGYLDNFGDAGRNIVVSGLGSNITQYGYSVLVYFNADNAGVQGFSAADNAANSDTAFGRQVGGGGTNYPLGGPDGFIVSTASTYGTAVAANVVRLDGFTGSTLTITGVAGGGGDRARPNGFQIVANTIPEPSSALLAGGALALGFIRRRRTA